MTDHRVALRPIGWRDYRFCRLVASDPGVRAASFDTRPPTWFGHLRWFTARRRRAYVLTRNGIRAGVVTVTRDASARAWIGIALRPSERGRGLGTAALNMVRLTLRATSPLLALHACIKPGNPASQIAFLRAGFRLYRPTCPHAHAAMEYRWC